MANRGFVPNMSQNCHEEPLACAAYGSQDTPTDLESLVGSSENSGSSSNHPGKDSVSTAYSDEDVNESSTAENVPIWPDTDSENGFFVLARNWIGLSGNSRRTRFGSESIAVMSSCLGSKKAGAEELGVPQFVPRRCAPQSESQSMTPMGACSVTESHSNPKRKGRKARKSGDANKLYSAGETHDGEVTTLMIQNIPRYINKARFVKALGEAGFEGSYDFCFVPMEFDSGRSRGYAFVNLSSSTAAKSLSAVWNMAHLFGTNVGGKPLKVTVAAIQGRAANVELARSTPMRRIKNPAFQRLVLKDEHTPVSQSFSQHSLSQSVSAEPVVGTPYINKAARKELAPQPPAVVVANRPKPMASQQGALATSVVPGSYTSNGEGHLSHATGAPHGDGMQQLDLRMALKKQDCILGTCSIRVVATYSVPSQALQATSPQPVTIFSVLGGGQHLPR